MPTSRQITKALLARIIEAHAAPDTTWDLAYRICPATSHLHTSRQKACQACVETNCCALKAKGLADDGLTPLPCNQRPACGARTRSGGLCKLKVEPGKHRCKFHGGLSTGPKTPAGKAAIARAQIERHKKAKYKAE